MKSTHRPLFALRTLAVLILGAPAVPAQQASAPEPAHRSPDLTPVKPESVGFSSAMLENLHALIQGEIDQKHLAGAVTILARHGKIVEYRTYGQRDLPSAKPMTRDTIFRDYSMTKPVTGVTMMILYEQGKWLPDEPISIFYPSTSISLPSWNFFIGQVLGWLVSAFRRILQRYSISTQHYLWTKPTTEVSSLGYWQGRTNQPFSRHSNPFTHST
jgi:CubicO group peptidase (beta-lactamase class C family)